MLYPSSRPRSRGGFSERATSTSPSSSRAGRRRRSTTPGSSSRPSSSEPSSSGRARRRSTGCSSSEPTHRSSRSTSASARSADPGRGDRTGRRCSPRGRDGRVEVPDAFIARVREVYTGREVRTRTHFRDGRPIARSARRSPAPTARTRRPLVVARHHRGELGRVRARGGRARAGGAGARVRRRRRLPGGRGRAGRDLEPARRA